MEQPVGDSILSRWFNRARRRIYLPLDPAMNEIRLLKIHQSRSQANSTLRVTLVRSSLEDVADVEYETISYAWGDPTLSAKIVVNSMTLLFPRETQKALLRLRLRDKPRTVWIDAVCINQMDKAERSRQVAIMSQIYRKGIRNVVYLGDDNEHSAPEAVRSLSAVYHGEIREETNDFEMIHSTLNDSQNRFIRSDKPLRTKLDVEALRNFFASAWFRRLWIVPEAVCARESICIAGMAQIDLLVVVTAAVWIYYHKGTQTDRREEFGLGMGHAGQLGVLLLFEQHSRNLLSLMTMTKHRLATDSRDKVFAIATLLSRAARDHDIPNLLRPDYNKPLTAVLRDATRYTLSNTGSLVSLGAWDHRSDGPLELDGFCSWTLPLHLASNSREVTAELEGSYSCGKTLGAHSWQSWSKEPIEDLDALELRGFRIDRVRWRSSRMTGPVSASTMLELLSELGSMDDLALTLVAGRSSMGFGSDLECSSAFRAYQAYISFHGEHPPTQDRVSLDSGETLAAAEYWAVASQCCSNRRLFLTSTGLLGLGGPAIMEDDVVAVLYGGPWPYILRPLGSAEEHQFIGRAYIQGVMNGEAVDRHVDSKSPDEVFRLR